MTYSDEEVRVLVEEYLELRSIDRSFVRVRLMDLTKNLPRLPWVLLYPLVMHYSLHYPVDMVADAMDVHPNTIYRRAEAGLEQLTHYMNGGTRWSTYSEESVPSSLWPQ